MDNDMPVMEYLLWFKTRKEHLLNCKFNGTTYTRTLFSIWRVASDKSSVDATHRNALTLIKALMDNSYIFKEF